MGGRNAVGAGRKASARPVLTEEQLVIATKYWCENRTNKYGVAIPMFFDETAVRDFRAALEAAGVEVKHGS